MEKRKRISRKVLTKKSNDGRQGLPNIKIYHKALVIKTTQTHRPMEQNESF